MVSSLVSDWVSNLVCWTGCGTGSGGIVGGFLCGGVGVFGDGPGVKFGVWRVTVCVSLVDGPGVGVGELLVGFGVDSDCWWVLVWDQVSDRE